MPYVRGRIRSLRNFVVMSSFLMSMENFLSCDDVKKAGGPKASRLKFGPGLSTA